MPSLRPYQLKFIQQLRTLRGRVLPMLDTPADQAKNAAVDRVRKLATDAIQQYSDDVFAGGEPVFPDWTRDVLAVCDEHEAMAEALSNRSAGIAAS